jgi:cytoskeleton protein RodZ
MASLGTYLRELRSAKDVSLDEVMRATRVGRAHLEALEAEDLASLPAPVFVKGFIRAYCEFLQADPAEALAHYRALTGERAHTATAGHVEPRAAGIGRGPVFVSVVLLVVLGVALFALNSGRSSSSRAPRTPPASAPAPVAVAPTVSTPAPPAGAGSTEPARRSPEPAASPAPDAPAAPATPAVAPLPATPSPVPVAASRPAQRLVVKALEPTWIRVQIDGTRSVEELLPAGATREWSAEKRFVLTVGNAGGISLELNGRALPPIGAPGAVIRELVLPADGG